MNSKEIETEMMKVANKPEFRAYKYIGICAEGGSFFVKEPVVGEDEYKTPDCGKMQFSYLDTDGECHELIKDFDPSREPYYKKIR